MATIDENRLIGNWSLKEKLVLASAVARYGTDNWKLISKVVKNFIEPNRPSYWCHYKKCKLQYRVMIRELETLSRKRTHHGREADLAEELVKVLSHQRQVELKKLMEQDKAEYMQTQNDIAALRSGYLSETQLAMWNAEIEIEEKWNGINVVEKKPKKIPPLPVPPRRLDPREYYNSCWMKPEIQEEQIKEYVQVVTPETNKGYEEDDEGEREEDEFLKKFF